MKISTKNILIVLVVVLIGFGFYWFQVRPSEIKKNCIKEIESTSGGTAYQQFLKETGGINLELPEVGGKYKACLARNGL